MSDVKGKTVEPVLLVLNALCTLNSPSTHMIASTTGLSKWVVKRQLALLKSGYGVDFRYDRSTKAADGAVGHYVLTDLGVFDRRKVVQYFLPQK